MLTLLLATLAACDRDGAGPPAAGATCETEALPPRQLRLLTRREYDNTVRDLFGWSEARTCQSDAACDIEHESCVGGVCQADPCNLHTFVLPAQGGAWDTVHVAGTFNGWSPTVDGGGWAMTWVPERDLYVTKRALDDGEHLYKFVLNERDWVPDPANPRTTPDGYGGDNSVLTLRCEQGVDEGGALSFAAGFPVESRPEGYAFDNNAEAAVVTAVHVEQYLAAASALAELALQDRDALYGCDPEADRAGCAEAFAADFGRRAFRRPLTRAERQRYAALVTAWPDFDTGASVMLQVMLSSPYFLYRSEMGEPGEDGRYHLTPWETAAALSYFFWATTPDAELLSAAASGALDTPEGLEAQARRLLADPRARDVVGAFGVQWLGVERVASLDRSAALYPEFDARTRAAMLEGTRRFVSTVVFDREQTFDALLTARYTVADPVLAELYGLEHPTGGGFEVIDAGGRRAGVLGQASVLAATAHSDQTSPIRRGLFVRQTLLCQPLGTPPPNAGGVPDVDPDATTRERFAQHTSDPGCAACHQYIDPIGFGFEHFDAVGAWRERDGGLPIDAAGDMVDVEGLGTGTHAPFEGLPALADVLVASDAPSVCFTRQVYRFALGREESAADLCTLDDLVDGFHQSEDNVQELMVAIATSVPFTTRREADDATP